jgi:membrane protease YdiL (CAAX protease family)
MDTHGPVAAIAGIVPPNEGSHSEEGGLPPYSRTRVLGLWLLAVVPMVLVTWVVAPWLIPRLAWPAAAVYLALTSLGMLWQGALGLWALRREGVPLHWEAVRRRTWLHAPRDPKTGASRPWRFLWLVLCLPVALLSLLVGNVFTASWMALRMLRSPIAIDLSPGYAKSLDLASPEFSGQWWLLAPVLIACALSAFFGEELLFRGVLLPRMSGTFGRKGWFANATLFALYHAHVPLMLPFRWLAALVTVWPARRYRCNWLAVAVRGSECAGLVAAALVGILSPSFPPLGTPPVFPHIARRPPAADPRIFCRANPASLPSCAPGDAFAADVRCCNLSALDLRAEAENAACASFDDRTVWPPADRMPSGFEPKVVLETNANPGLGVRQLHGRGITGRGVGIAIIDSFLLVDHQEYDGRLRWYEELPGLRSSLEPTLELPAQMHAPAVASLAAGRTVGVAPGADLYFIGMDEDPRGLFLQAHFFAQGIRRIVQINRALPSDRKIRAVSISMGWGPECPGYADVTAAVNEAAREGIALFAIFIDGGFEGLGRPPESDPDRFDSHGPAARWADDFHDGRIHSDHIWVPVDARTVASPTGLDEYVFYRWGASSWIVPYLAGTYALAAQVDPTITREQFVALARQTGHTSVIQHVGGAHSLGSILDPGALIAALRTPSARPRSRHVPTMPST